MKDKIIKLIKLQNCDNKIKIMNNKMNEGPLEIQSIEDQLSVLKNLAHEENTKLEALKKDRRALEQGVLELEERIIKSQIKLSNIKSNKEYTAALKELDDLNKEKALREDKILHSMEEVEELEKKCAEGKRDQEQFEKQSEKRKVEILKELKELKTHSAILEKERDIFCQSIDPSLLSKYQFLKERRNGQAIGPAIKGVCQICYMGIPPQKFNELIRGDTLMTCPNCLRIIYWGDEKEYQDLTQN